MHVVGFGDQSATLVTHAERPDLEDQAQGEDFLSQWPTFMFHDPVANEHHSVPLAWDGSEEDLPDGWDEALVRGSIGAQDATLRNTLCARVDRRRLGLVDGRALWHDGEAGSGSRNKGWGMSSAMPTIAIWHFQVHVR